MLEIEVPNAQTGPLFDAWTACLEAVHGVGHALELVSAMRTPASTGETNGVTEISKVVDTLREAMSATRAATASIRFSLFEQTDELRSSAERVK